MKARCIAGAAGLVLCAAAAAQPACWPDMSMPVTLVAAQQGRTAKPGEIVYSASSVGLVYGWTCFDAGGVWHRYIVGAPWTEFRPDWLAVADRLWRGTDADRAAAWTQYVTATTIDARLAGDVDALKALMPPPPPPPAAGSYAVAPTTVCAAADKDASGKCVRRQTYVWANGARGLPAPERVDIGAPCDPSIGAAGFYGVLGRTDRVALCVRR